MLCPPFHKPGILNHTGRQKQKEKWTAGPGMQAGNSYGGRSGGKAQRIPPVNWPPIQDGKCRVRHSDEACLLRFGTLLK
jgi:hypothetical protein